MMTTATTPEASPPLPVPTPAPAAAARPDWHPAPPPPLIRRDWLWIAGIFLLALVLRVVYVYQLRSSPDFDFPGLDARVHDDWARAIAEGKRYWDGPYFRAPLYPWFLALVYKVFGPGYLLVRVIQAIIGSLSCSLIYLLGRDVFSRAAGAIAGVLAATYWVFLFFDAELLLPVLLVLLDVLGLWLVWRAAAHDRISLWCAAGVVLGLSAITRPNILVFFPLLVVWIVLLHWRRWDAVLTRGAAFTVACLLPIVPITVRNYTVGGDLVLISSQGGVNFYIGNNPRSDGTTAVVPGTRPSWWGGYYDSIGIAELDLGRKLRPSEVSKYFFNKAFEWWAAHPRMALRLTLLKTIMFWDRFELSNNKGIYYFSRTFTPIVKVLPVHFGIVAPLGLLGVGIALRQWRRYLPLWTFIFVYAASIIAFFITDRFRIPVIPFLMVFGASAVLWLIDAYRGRRTARLVAGLVALAVLYHLVNSPSAGRKEPVFHSNMIIGMIHTEKGEHEKAYERYLEAIEAAPLESVAHYRAALALAQLGRTEEALERAAKAFELAPADYETFEVYSDLLLRLGRVDEALAVVRKSVEAAPEDMKILTRAAFAILSVPVESSENLQEATRLAMRACELTRNLRAEPLLALATAYMQADAPQQALQMAQLALGRALEDRQSPLVPGIRSLITALEAMIRAPLQPAAPTTAPVAPTTAPAAPTTGPAVPTSAPSGNSHEYSAPAKP